MPTCQPRPLPCQWLFTDARFGARLLASIAALPPRSGVLVRHDHLPRGQRAHLLARIRRIARAHRLMLLVAGTGVSPGTDGSHLRRPTRANVARLHRAGRIASAPVHDRQQAAAARRAGVDMLFISPVHPTRSHPGAPSLGRAGFAGLAAGRAHAIALGGMDARRFSRLRGTAKGWAAIDALIR